MHTEHFSPLTHNFLKIREENKAEPAMCSSDMFIWIPFGNYTAMCFTAPTKQIKTGITPLYDTQYSLNSYFQMTDLKSDLNNNKQSWA